MIVEKIESEVKKLKDAVTKTRRVRILSGVILAPGVEAVAGDVFDLPQWMANQLVGHGQAERVQEDGGPAPDAPETLTVATIETATASDPKPKKVASK
jgi:hypothetical protein